MIRYLLIFFLTILSFTCSIAQQGIIIAHRGGVVDSTYTENGKPALLKAAELGYSAIEIDVRLTKDNVLIANHDGDLKRYYGKPWIIKDTEWNQISQLKSDTDQNSILKIEDVFRLCQKNHLSVMLDNKIDGLPVKAFEELLELLEKYGLKSTALMIGTDESTEFFTGKVRLSCTRKQLEANMQLPGYKPAHYFLFERPVNLTADDIQWAEQKHIMIVAAINKFHYRKSANMMYDAANDIHKMVSIGVKNFQIDSEFGYLLHKK